LERKLFSMGKFQMVKDCADYEEVKVFFEPLQQQ
jgi:hypothetical protein